MYYVSVIKHQGRPVVQIALGGKARANFPLTKTGCRAAGRWLAERRQTGWLNSSTVDYPEVSSRFRGDISELMQEGYYAALDT
jgi:hypothetical protein